MEELGMAVSDAHAGPGRDAETWERLLGLERQVQELRRLLLAGAPTLGAQYGDADRADAEHPARLPTREAPRADWQVTCLGPFRLSCGARPIAPCSSRRGWAILQFLLAQPGHTARRDVPIEAFWPGAHPARGAHRLQMAIHALRRSLRGCGPGGNDEAIVFHDGQYLLNPALTLDLDVVRFQEACERGAQLADAEQPEAARRVLEAALALYGGPFLASGSHDEWAEAPRAALHERRLGALGRLSEVYAALGAWEQAARCCQEILAADPYREDAIRQLLRCLAATGRLAEVERTYRACRARIWHDLQVEPAPETTRLYHQIVLAPRRQSVLTGT